MLHTIVCLSRRLLLGCVCCYFFDVLAAAAFFFFSFDFLLLVLMFWIFFFLSLYLCISFVRVCIVVWLSRDAITDATRRDADTSSVFVVFPPEKLSPRTRPSSVSLFVISSMLLRWEISRKLRLTKSTNSPSCIWRCFTVWRQPCINVSFVDVPVRLDESVPHRLDSDAGKQHQHPAGL